MSLPFDFDDIKASLMNSTLANSVNSYISQYSDGGTQFSLQFSQGKEVEDLINIIIMTIGLLFILFGCRLFKSVLFAIVFLFTSASIYYLAVQQGQNQSLMFGVALFLGFFAALLSIKLFKLALFVAGFSCGVVLFIAVKSLYPSLIATQTAEMSMLIFPGLFLGICSVLLEKYWLLLATPIIGSFLFMQGLDHFQNYDINVFGTLAGTATCATDECYALWACTFGLSIVGVLIQYRYTAGFSSSSSKSSKYTPTPPIRRNKHVQLVNAV